MAKVFTVGDKVFAKVRGYPAWPALVEKIEVSSNKNKYHVLFYGTMETAVCKMEDLYSYVDFKEKYGKPLKRKGFNEALAQIEGVSPVPVLFKRQGKLKEQYQDSGLEDNLIAEENQKHTDAKRKAVKRKRDSGIELIILKTPISDGNNSSTQKRFSVPPQKRFKKVGHPTRDTGNAAGNSGSLDSKLVNGSLSLPNKPEIISRSGRKIKPKKFADEDTFDHSVLNPDGDTSQRESAVHGTNKILPLHGDSDGNLSVNTKSRKRISGRNSSLMNDSGPRPSSVLPRKKDSESNSEIQSISERNFSKVDRLTLLRNEVRMLEIENMIRGHLCIKRANTAQCINLLKQLCDLYIEPLMLKKHPEVVKTMKKLRRYVGNLDAWDLSQEQARAFSDDAHQIRTIGNSLYTKFREMFTVPEGRTFWQVFVDEVSAFRKKTESLPTGKVCALTEDPTGTSFDLQNVQAKKKSTETVSIPIQETRKEAVDVNADSDCDQNSLSPIVKNSADSEMLNSDKNNETAPTVATNEVNSNNASSGTEK